MHEKKREYTYRNETGDAKIQVYHIFPGIEVAYISAHTAELDFSCLDGKYQENDVGIHFCREGRLEQEMDQEFFYLMPDDCWVTTQNHRKNVFQLPLSHYHGISIGIDSRRIQSKFAEFLGNDAMHPEEIVRRLCETESSVILRSIEPLKHIFYESYDISEECRIDFLKIKVLEVFFMLSQQKTQKDVQETYAVSRTKAELAKNAVAYIDQHLNTKIQLKDLTRHFGVSDTCLQQAFRSVYGMPVASFIRVQKMHKAAQELIHTNRSIDVIAETYGYMNESKFSAVFKKIMGDSPSVYRKEHSQIKII